MKASRKASAPQHQAARKSFQRGGRLDLKVRLDRIRVAAEYFPNVSFRMMRELRRAYDFDVSRSKKLKGEQVTYQRVCRWINDSTGTQIEGSYQPVQRWLPACVITLVGNDNTGLLRQEVDEILTAIENPKLVHVEVAMDFDSTSIVNGDFVYRHLLVGKARHSRSSRAPGFEYYGTRRSPKFVRAYKKTLK